MGSGFAEIRVSKVRNGAKTPEEKVYFKGFKGPKKDNLVCVLDLEKTHYWTSRLQLTVLISKQAVRLDFFGKRAHVLLG